MLKVAIIGGSGYTGVELLRILALHPRVTVTAVTSRANLGKKVDEVFPSLHGLYDHLEFSNPDPGRLLEHADLFFTAVPHRAAMSIVPDLLEAGKRVIDLSADFRIRDKDVYEQWYQPHTAPELLEKAAYGLPELYRERIAGADLVANPGCYPTSAILPLAPLLKARVISHEGIIVDSKSGVSGAGRGANAATSFCEVNEGFKAYKVASHRHTPEIEQELSAACGRPVTINFTPHLVPMNRGILTTIYADLAGNASTADILDILQGSYGTSPFVHVLPRGSLPDVAHVKGGNDCRIGAVKDERTGKVILVSAIDNLVKGASGQAVQNLNVMHGWDETLGLKGSPLYP